MIKNNLDVNNLQSEQNTIYDKFNTNDIKTSTSKLDTYIKCNIYEDISNKYNKKEQMNKEEMNKEKKIELQEETNKKIIELQEIYGGNINKDYILLKKQEKSVKYYNID